MREAYVASLASTEYRNPDYRGNKLKSKIEKHEKYANSIGFTRLSSSSKFATYLVFNKNTPIQDLVKHSYQLGAADTMTQAGLSGREAIKKAFQSTPPLEWPPSPAKLYDTDIVPSSITHLLGYLMFGKPIHKNDTIRYRLIDSIGQDICRAVTYGRWKLPKHIALSMTIRHLFRSKELATLLNRFGHSENYNFSTELETAIANSLEKSSSLLSNQIVRYPTVPFLFHSAFDNFDQYVNSLHGSGSVHTAHGIMMQELSDEQHGGHTVEPIQIKRTKERSMPLELNSELPGCYVSQRKSPALSILKWEDPYDGFV